MYIKKIVASRGIDNRFVDLIIGIESWGAKRFPLLVETGQNSCIVQQFKYLGIINDSHLSFKAHIKKVCNRVKFSLADFNIYIACNILEMHNLQRANRIPHPTRTAIKWYRRPTRTRRKIRRIRWKAGELHNLVFGVVL